MTIGHGRRGLWTPALLVALGVGGVLALPAAAAKDDLVLVSRASGPAGAAADSSSSRPSVSADGRFVAFSSTADNLSSEDNNAVENVFVRDLATATTTLVSRASGPGGAAADAGSGPPRISADGRFVAFASDADNLSGEDNNAFRNVFVRDLGSSTTTLVSRAPGPGGAAADATSSAPAISADGRFVAFESDGDNLSTEDNNAVLNIFVRDLAAGATTLVSRASGPGGVGGNDTSLTPAISASGRVVAFGSLSDNLSTADNNAAENLFVRDLDAESTTFVNRADGAGGAADDSGAFRPSLSADGRFVAFDSVGDNLSAQDNNGVFNVFVRDLSAGTTTFVSRAAGPTGTGGDGDSAAAQISPDARFVAFHSRARNLSSEANTLVFVQNIFVRDLATGATTFVSRGQGPSGVAADGFSYWPTISSGGRYVAFSSDADTISGEDTNGVEDVFVRDVLGSPATPPPSPPGSPGGGAAAVSVSLTATSLAGGYAPRGLRARLVLKGSTTAPGVSLIRLRRTKGPASQGLVTAATLRLRLTKAGRFTARLKLPGKLAPGRYALSVGDVPVPGKPGVLAIARPASGILSRAFASVAVNGPQALSVPRGTRIIYCNFQFALVPARGPVTTEWRTPAGLSGRTGRPRLARVAGFVRGADAGARPLPPGRYTCTLRVARARMAAVSIRVK